MASGLLHDTRVEPLASRLETLRERTRGSRALPLAIGAALSAVAGLLHAAVIPAHLTDWPLSGAFFILVAVAQCTYAIVLLRDPPRLVVTAGLAGTTALLGLYAVSRTLGIPFGPHPFQAEPVGTLDLLCEAAELGLLITLLHLGSSERVPDEAPVRRARPMFSISAALLVATMATAAGSPVAGHHGQGDRVYGTALDEHLDEDLLHLEWDDHTARTRGHASGDRHREQRCTKPQGFAASLKPNTDPARASAFAYHDHDGNLWLYNMDSGETTKVLYAPGCWFEQAQIRDPRSLSLSTDGKIWSLDLDTGAVERVKLPGWVSVHDWSPDGSKLAFLTWPDDGGGVDVRLYDAATGAIRLLLELRREVEHGCGGDGGGPSTSIQWSRDGSKLLVEEPFFIGENIFAIDAASGKVIRELDGAYGMFLPDSRTILSQQYDSQETSTWQLNGVAKGGLAKAFMVPGWRDRPVLSPDGKLLAYDDNKRHASTYVLDLTTGRERQVSAKHAAPTWIDNETLAVNQLGLCRPYVCGHYPWPQGDIVDLVAVDGGEPVAIQASSSVHAAVIFGTALPARSDRPGVPTFEPRDEIDATPLFEVRFEVRATDPEGSELRYEASALPDGATFDPQTREFRWNPHLTQEGRYKVTFIATDDHGMSGRQTVTIVVHSLIEALPVRQG